MQWYQKTCTTKQQLDAAVSNFDRVFEQNTTNGWEPGQFRVVPDHTKPGQFRVQHYQMMMDGKPQWRKVFTGSQAECDHWMACR